MLRKPRFIRAVAAAAITLGTLSIGAAASASAAPTGIPNYLVSAIAINKAAHTATLPLYRGEAPGIGRVWFILTESSNLADAERLGINWAPKLANAIETPAVQHATLAGGGGNRQFGRDSFVRFSGGVNLSQPARSDADQVGRTARLGAVVCPAGATALRRRRGAAAARGESGPCGRTVTGSGDSRRAGRAVAADLVRLARGDRGLLHTLSRPTRRR